MKGIPLEGIQHQIELDTLIPPTRQVGYQLNPNYVAIAKQDIDKLFATCFIKHAEKTICLSPIVAVPKKNGKLRICVDFRKLKQLLRRAHTCYLLLTRLLINTVVGHEVYTFLDVFLDTIKFP